MNATRDPFRPFAEHVEGFSHPSLALLPSYTDFRRALADLVDATDLPLGVFLADVRQAAVSSPFGALCPGCGVATVWPWRGNRHGGIFTGTYNCPTCNNRFTASHEIGLVTWHNGRALQNFPTRTRGVDGTAEPGDGRRDGQNLRGIRT